jgi:hypothetical protein
VIVSTDPRHVVVQVGGPAKQVITMLPDSGVDVTVGTPGIQGIPGPEGGTPVIALPFDQWPPVNPQPNTLYLRLAP